MSEPFVTVLIDTYNYGHFIEEAIESVLSQDFPMEDVEILVVDDGSTDDTAERVKKYGPRIRYFYKENGGQASAFNLGISKAHGEIVALLDADDYFLPGKLSRLASEFKSHPSVGMVYHPLRLSQANSAELREFPMVLVSGFLPEEKAKLLAYEPYPTSCLAFRRQALDQLLPIPEVLRLQADAYPALLIVLIAPVLALPEALAVYRIHGRNLSIIDYTSLEKEAVLRRIDGDTAIMKLVAGWVTRNKHRLKEREAGQFLRHRMLWLEEQRFAVEPPGRLRYFLFLIRQNHARSAAQTWKFTVFNYVSAFCALASGFEGAAKMNEWRERTIRATRALRASKRPHSLDR